MLALYDIQYRFMDVWYTPTPTKKTRLFRIPCETAFNANRHIHAFTSSFAATAAFSESFASRLAAEASLP